MASCDIGRRQHAVPGLGEMEGSPPRHGAWVRDAELQEDPLTRFLLRWDEFEVGDTGAVRQERDAGNDGQG